MFDISILEIQKRVLEVKFTNGDTFLGELSEAERETLADELASLELEKVAKIIKATMAHVESGSKKDDLLEPLGPSILGSTLLGLGHALVTHMVEGFRKDDGVDITKDAMAPT